MIHEQGSESDSSPPEALFETPPPVEASSPESPATLAHLTIMLRVGKEKIP